MPCKKHQRKCAISSTNAAVLPLLFKQATSRVSLAKDMELTLKDSIDTLHHRKGTI